MAAHKGHKKVGGRKKGSLNVKTREVLDAVQRVIDLIQDNYLDRDIAMMQPAERMRFYTGLLEYVRPKLARTDLTTDGEKIDLRPKVIVNSQEEAEKLNRLIDGA